jgi:predicted O-methyltransferase YrrM
MLQKLFRVNSYLKYVLKRKGRHKIHSPFVYEFYNKVLHDRTNFSDYTLIMKSLKNTLSNRNVIETVDFGAAAGNKEFATYRARVGEITKKRTLRIKYLKLLYRIVHYFNPENILEFGTSTGNSTVSLALGNRNARVVTMEGCASVAAVAQDNFDRLKLKNVNIVIGNFNVLLASTLNDFNGLDLVFFDGNHKKIPTIDYFNHCLTKADENTVFVFDDIHWSEEMEESWEIIKSNTSVSLSIDLYQFGLVFFKKGIEKQHFVLSI